MKNQYILKQKPNIIIKIFVFCSVFMAIIGLSNAKAEQVSVSAVVDQWLGINFNASILEFNTNSMYGANAGVSSLNNSNANFLLFTNKNSSTIDMHDIYSKVNNSKPIIYITNNF